MKSVEIKLAIIVALLAVCGSAGWVILASGRHETLQVVPVTHWNPVDVSRKATSLPKSKYAAESAMEPAMASSAYAPGWPVQLPGAIVSTPVVADLLGDGRREIVVACRAVEDLRQHIVEGEPLLYAFRMDGSELPHWPVALQEQKQEKPGEDMWTSTPSVFRRDGKENLVLVGGHAGIVVVHGDGTLLDLGGGSDWHDTIPLADFDGDGIPDIAIGKYIANVDGHRVKGWPPSKQLYDGYAPCIGDALGNGSLKLFHLFYSPPNNNTAYVCGFDTHGDPLPGWPRNVDNPSCCAPVMGDVLGNGKMQIIASYGGHLFAWNADGTPLPNTGSKEEMSGILKSGISASAASPSLADLDGDGRAEIVIYDRASHSIRAWHADGSGVRQPPPTSQEVARDALNTLMRRITNDDDDHLGPIAASDGLVARLPAEGGDGVSVVSLGDDATVMDFFTGIYWVRRFHDGKTTMTRMTPYDIACRWIQPTVADLEANGTADVIFGTSDGRLFVYRTGLACHAERLQWPTANGNFQHTGVWRKSPPASQ